MRAVLLTGYGDVDQLELREVPEPEAGPGELKVRVTGSSVNPIDYFIRLGRLRERMNAPLPMALGRDASGEVVGLGAGATSFALGAKVVGLVNGAYAEYVVAREDAWAEVPPSLDLLDAAAIPLVALTGWQLINEAVKPQAGDTVLVTGAVGGVGRAAVFAAREQGAKVFAGVRAAHRAAASELDVDGVVALDEPADVERMPQVDAIANTIVGATVQRILGKVRPGGTFGSVTSEVAGAKAAGLVVRWHQVHEDRHRLAALASAVAAGKLVIPISARLPMIQIREAHVLAENGAGGKVVLRVR
jgi:NADPH:quinone reductase-like Zn-dependent oxidoreductase